MQKLLMTVWSVVLVLGVTGVGVRVVTDEPLPPRPPDKTTVRLLVADPDHFAGRDVTFPCGLLEAAPDGTLIFRPAVPGPAVLVCRMRAGAVPDPRPAALTGRCAGAAAGVVAVDDCR